ncbi:putative proline rich protein [Mycobacterium ulcerans str. Harvey]|uniref:Proline rich protein n=1 Tax=Mycobacterium ulcerans str. Harvey TaxID=1299332 RepID=A0ABN0R6E6_MYCUL|nr:putative proline rich protein [Mycobacterium ulcerans str. Harvey]
MVGAQLGALRGALLTEPALAPNGVAAAVVSDAAAALAALRPTPGFPASGVVALCDFGAGGTSVTLAQVGSSLQQIGPTFRYREFSGDEIDQLILNHILTVTPGIDSAEVSGTATSMGSVTLLLGGCRFAKEHLSAAPVATIATGAAGSRVPISGFPATSLNSSSPNPWTDSSARSKTCCSAAECHGPAWPRWRPWAEALPSR